MNRLQRRQVKSHLRAQGVNYQMAREQELQKQYAEGVAQLGDLLVQKQRIERQMGEASAAISKINDEYNVIMSLKKAPSPEAPTEVLAEAPKND